MDTRSLLLPLALLACAVGAAAMTPPTAAADAPQRTVFDSIPDDAEVFIAIGQLRSASDQVQQWLEGMDRAELLFGTRPLDQAKSALNIGIAIDELAGAALFFLSHDDALQAFLLLPTTDAEAFLSGNFDRVHDGDDEADPPLPCDDVSMHRHKRFGMVAARPIDGYVLLGRDAEALCAYEPGEGVKPRLERIAENRMHMLADQGDVLIFARRDAAEEVLMRLNRNDRFAAAQALLPDALLPDAIHHSVDDLLLVIDFDPLALFLRGIVALETESELGVAVREARRRGGGLRYLPHRPYFIAMSADVAGLGGEAALRALEQMTGSHALMPLVREIVPIHVSIFAEDAGGRGGLLQRGSLLLHTEQPADALATFRQHVTAGALGESSAWKEPSQLPGIGTVELFEIRPDVDDSPLMAMAIGPLLGSPAWEGAAIETDEALALTFSRGRAAVEDVLQRAGGADPNLNQNMIIRSMRTFLPPSPQLELYIDVGRASDALRPLLEAWSRMTGARVRPLPRDLPPIAYAVSTRAHGYEHGLIIPAGVCAVFADQLLDQIVRGRFMQQRREASDDEDNRETEAAP